MVLILLLLKILSFFVLFRLKLVLLLLVFFVQIRTPGVGRGRVLAAWNIVGVNHVIGAGSVVIFGVCVVGFSAGGRLMHRASFFGSDHPAALQLSRPCCSSNGRLPVIRGST